MNSLSLPIDSLNEPNSDMTDYDSSNGWAQQNDTFSPIHVSFQWDYADAQSPKNIVNHYNDLLQRVADFYTTLDDPFDSTSSLGLDNMYRSIPKQEESATRSVVTQVLCSIPNKIQKRREQNRTSQRAYRERKERYLKELEEQVGEWQLKHQILSRSYSERTVEITKLKSQIEKLNGEISQLQFALPTLCGSLHRSP